LACETQHLLAEYSQHATCVYDKHIFVKLLVLMARLDPHGVLH